MKPCQTSLNKLGVVARERGSRARNITDLIEIVCLSKPIGSYELSVHFTEFRRTSHTQQHETV